MGIRRYKTNQTLVSSGFNQPFGQTLTLSGNTLIASGATFRYVDDLSSSYVARSIVDAEYVTGLTSGIDGIGFNQEVIYRGVSGITGATGFLYDVVTSGVTVPNLCISTMPVDDDTADWLLTWDGDNCEVRKVPFSSSVGLSSVENGLSSSSGVACLGGDLTQDTTIDGIDIHSLTLSSLCGVCVITTANNIVLDSRLNSGGIFLKSQNGSIASPVTNYSESVGIGMDYVSNVFKIYDNRSGANQSGIEYAGDYNTYFSPRSLVDKQYVDNIANALYPKQAVQAATTPADGNILLSGDTGTIDNIQVGDIILSGNRILVKNQTNGALNGVYSASTGNWGRTSDFDFSPIVSEVVQGSYFFVISGATQATQTWVLTTPDIITSGDTLSFTLFSRVNNIDGGTGITITINSCGTHVVSVNGESLAGNGIVWTGDTFNIASSIVTGATNGLTKNGRVIALGGDLTEPTTINLGTFDLKFSGDSLQYSADYSVDYNARSIPDVDYVTGYTQSAVTLNSNVLNVVDFIGTGYTATTTSDFIGASGGTTILLPNPPKTGQRIVVADIQGNASGNPITIDGNGNNILDDLTATINTNYGSITVIYNTNGFWSAAAFIN